MKEVAVSMENVFLPEHRYLHMVNRVERLYARRNAFIAENDKEHTLMAIELQRLEKQLCDLEQEIANKVV